MTFRPDSTFSLVSPVISDRLSSSETPIKLGVLASGNGSNFAAVAKAIENGQINAQIPVLIYNNPGAKAAIRAASLGIETVLLNHREYKNREALDRKIVQTLRQHDVDLVILAGWMRLVTSVLIDAFPHRMINIHPSLLPSFKGLHAVEQALQAKVTITGCTVHLVCLEVDSGPILIQAAVPVFPEDTPETLHARIQIQEHRILPQGIAIAASQLQTSLTPL
ncbi:phosphoribosylglycinamide formyltransferase [Nostoc sp. PCC 7107]|uniref:phosphoribosylglycinamide formyltransferase n=1 Tax=Nostoc sp. PCC 7107 TaxID=317936 RepID=UPI00029F0E2B|nr:phosphoribosylglycinamide formyltransferase [Nostoc sp. PCC 7107]AFY41190.1 formyltetrahydrofolate-dependent phosphoribosylglycinamide formyltransferase [Nostoc sp. PCC 7107]